MGDSLTESEKRIFEAIAKNDVTALSALLVEKQNVNIVDKDLMTPLQHASYKGNKEMVQMLLDQGADVNLCKHQHDYTCLHFAALSGNAEVCLQLLNAGAKANAENGLNRTAAQMGAFVGNHNCVATINTFISPSEVSKHCNESSKIPNYIIDSLHKFLMQTNIFPIRIAINLQTYPGLSEHLQEIKTLLENMRDSEIKKKNFNEVIAFKLHYLAQIIIKVIKLRSSNLKSSELTELFTKKFLKKDSNSNSNSSLNSSQSFPFMDEVIIESVRCFPYRESTLFRQMVTSLSNAGSSNPFGVINAAINGQRGFADSIPLCDTCREEKPAKKCSKCKAVQYCDRNCQRLHWFAHKKECSKLANELQQENSNSNQTTKQEIDVSSLSEELQQIIKAENSA